MADLLGHGNKKYRKYGKRLLTFGLPALKSDSGKVICNYADACKEGCYAHQCRYLMPNVREAQERRLRATLRDDFVEVMDAELRRRKPIYVRIHDSGDFYSPRYFRNWIAIARHNPDVRFFAYTKALPIVQNNPGIPKNLFLVMSEGGKCDARIKAEDTVARVFETEETLTGSGWGNGMKDDVKLITEGCKKIGLVYHGSPRRAFKTSR